MDNSESSTQGGRPTQAEFRLSAEERLRRRRSNWIGVGAVVLSLVCTVDIPWVFASATPGQSLYKIVPTIIGSFINAGCLIAFAIHVAFETFRQRTTSPLVGVLLIFAAYLASAGVFGAIYSCISLIDKNAFNHPLGIFDSAYFSITTLATVGFGDILAQTNTAKAAVCTEIVFGTFFNVVIFALLATYLSSRLVDFSKANE